MKRHRTDMVALLFGLAFSAVGAAFLVQELTDTDLDGAWLSAFVFVTLGIAALAATLFRHRQHVHAHELAPAAVAAADTLATDTEADDA